MAEHATRLARMPKFPASQPGEHSNDCWGREGDAAGFQCGPLLGKIIDRGGLSGLRWGDQPIPGELWQVLVAEGKPLAESSERYARGDDYVTTHEPTPSFPIRTQLCRSLHALEAGEVVAITLTVSMETTLLDARPSLTLASTLGRDNATATEETASGLAGIGRWIGGDASAGWRCFEAPHPLDRRECEAVAMDGACALRFHPPFLEKGVIRRGRFLALFVGAEIEDRAVTAAFESFAAAPLPLTA